MFRLSDVSELKKGQLYTLAIIFVLALITIAVTAWKWNKLKSWIADKTSQKQAAKDIVTTNLTISSSQAKTFAEQLYTAMKGPGTDEDVIYRVFEQVNTIDDVLLIISKFGTKDDETLPQWIIGDLNASERKKLNNILSNKNINYSF